MNSQKMFLSLVPWLLFSCMTHRHGADSAGIAALIAAGLALFLLVRGTQRGESVKVIDATGVATFAALAAVCFIGGSGATDRVADYGRGIAALVLAAVMLVSTITVPFTEQYARETVPSEYWRSPVFRSINRRISLLWGAIVTVMALGHLAAGLLDPATDPNPGARPVDLALNWLLPIGLILLAVRWSNLIAAGARPLSPSGDGDPLPRPEMGRSR